MTRTARPSVAFSRRRWLTTASASLAVPALGRLLGCSPASNSATAASIDSSDAGAAADAGLSAASATAADAANTAGDWATGGTRLALQALDHADPFTSETATRCALTCETTIGPCHTSSVERTDLSDGWDGLPMRIALRIVDEDCNPVPDAIVELWHTNYQGIYSGRINSMCNKDESDRAAAYFRGYQRSDDAGRVEFVSCFPGWYSGRAVHIHVRVQKSTYEGSDQASAWVITQLLFTDELVLAICGSEPLYRDKGQPDTWLTDDNVVGGETDPSPYLFDVQKLYTGVMLASKTLVLRASLDSASCAVQGAQGGMNGPGGSPPTR